MDRPPKTNKEIKAQQRNYKFDVKNRIFVFLMSVGVAIILLTAFLLSNYIQSTSESRSVIYESAKKPGHLKKWIVNRLKGGLKADKRAISADVETPKTLGNKRKVDDDEDVSMLQDYEQSFRFWSLKPRSYQCWQTPRRREDRRKNRNRLRIASFNAEWLFLFGGGGSVGCPGPGCPWWTDQDAREHFHRTIQLLVKLDADIIHLNEIEDCRVLKMLTELMPAGHGYRVYMIEGRDTSTGQNVGFLSRIDPAKDLKRSEFRASYPISESSCGIKRSFSKGQGRSGTMGLTKHYLAHFEIPLMTLAADAHADARTLRIVWAGAHLIAQPRSLDRCLRREAQATVLSRAISDEVSSLAAHSSSQKIAVIVTGDLNDHDEDVLGANGDLPLSSTLSVLKHSLSIKSVASLISDPQTRYSSWHDGNRNCIDDGFKEHSLIDHILMSQELVERVTAVWMDHNQTVSCHDRTSDHWPIIVDIKT